MSKFIAARRISLALGLILMFLGSAMAEEGTLPQMSPAGLAGTIEYTAPQNPADNPGPVESRFAADGYSYHDDSLDIQIHKARVYDTPIHIAFVQIADPDQLRTEQAKPYPSEASMRVDVLAKRVNAVLAINADWFVYHKSGIIYRNGTLLRDRPSTDYDGLVIDANGDLHIVSPITEEGFAAIETPIIQSFAFGPALVIDGEVQEIRNRKDSYEQRMAIGQIAPLSYVMVASDGLDQKDSVGLTLPQLASVMKELGAHTAYNLDGGQSSCLMLNYQKLNGQNARKKLRAVGDIIYFVSAMPN